MHDQGEDVDGLVGRGEALLKKEDWEGAVRTFEKALKGSGGGDRDVSVFLIYFLPRSFSSSSYIRSPPSSPHARRSTPASKKPRDSSNSPNKKTTTKSSASPETRTPRRSKLRSGRRPRPLILIKGGRRRRWRALMRLMRF
jgi:hypothetical protein